MTIPTFMLAAAAMFLGGAVVLVIGQRFGRLRGAWSRYALNLVIVSWILLPAALGEVFRVTLGATMSIVAWELARLGRTQRSAADAWVVAAIAGACVITGPMWPRAAVLAVEIAAIVFVACAALGALARVRLLLASTLPIAAGLALARLSPPEDRLLPLAFVYGIVETGDALAYLVGSAFGRTLLWPRVSAKKTVLGAIAGVTTGVAVGALLSSIEQRGLLRAAAWGGALAMLAIVADLATSAIKRRAGVKDFASWVPHHGGVLDVYDSLILVGIVWHAIRSV